MSDWKERRVPELNEMLAREGRSVTLRMEPEGLTLTDGNLSIRGDLTRMIPRLAPGRLQGEFLVKAAKMKGDSGDQLLAVDATAGLGEDSLLLAAAGWRVILFEYDPVIAALLQDSLERAACVPELADAVSRMELREEDSIMALYGMGTAFAKDAELGESALRAGTEPNAAVVRPDLVLLDPMFPERQKSALVKKKFQLLQQLESPCAEERSLLAAAMAAGPRKIVIKRPLKGPFLGARNPSYSIKGKAIRYDCIVLPR